MATIIALAIDEEFWTKFYHNVEISDNEIVSGKRICEYLRLVRLVGIMDNELKITQPKNKSLR
jgi:hypothetical protein